jgi:uncharacterized protein YidB (DUF937 family)
MDLSNLGGMAAGVDPNTLAPALTQLIDSHGGVQGLAEKLRGAGLGGAVDSWISTGSNHPVEPQQLGNALGADSVNHLASTTGLNVQTLLPLLASILPMVMDHLTPGGNLPVGGGTGDVSGLPGVIGNVLGGGGLGGLLGR